MCPTLPSLRALAVLERTRLRRLLKDPGRVGRKTETRYGRQFLKPSFARLGRRGVCPYANAPCTSGHLDRERGSTLESSQSRTCFEVIPALAQAPRPRMVSVSRMCSRTDLG
jgi:hypothetical protein